MLAVALVSTLSMRELRPATSCFRSFEALVDFAEALTESVDDAVELFIGERHAFEADGLRCGSARGEDLREGSTVKGQQVAGEVQGLRKGPIARWVCWLA
jgi:hypothetical protein